MPGVLLLLMIIWGGGSCSCEEDGRLIGIWRGTGASVQDEALNPNNSNTGSKQRSDDLLIMRDASHLNWAEPELTPLMMLTNDDTFAVACA
jgi:hypothetical protein